MVYVWPIGVAILAVAGFAAAWLPRRRAAATASRTAWSAAQAAMETARVSRDAAPAEIPEADRLLQRAELLAARHGGADAADSTAAYARQADRLWREAANG